MTKRALWTDLALSAAPVKVKRPKGCKNCGYYKSCTTPKIGVKGEGKAGILVIIDQPSLLDDARGNSLYAASHNHYLKKALSRCGIDMQKDCHIVSAVRCYHDGGTQHPKFQAAVEACRSQLLDTVAELKPKVIITVGPHALRGLIGDRIGGRLKGVHMDAFMGEAIPDHSLGAWICPVEATAHMSDQRNDYDINRFFKRHVKKAVKCLKKKISKIKSDVKVTMKADEAIKWIEQCIASDDPEFVIDLETSGLNPYTKEHFIACASLCFEHKGKRKTYGFWWHQDNPKFKKAMIRLILKKLMVAHNAQYELIWLRHFLGFWGNLAADTMVDAHLLNNHRKVSLKYITFCEFGDIGYDDEVDYYLTETKPWSNKKSIHRVNLVDECSPTLLCTYCAMDSLYTKQLRERQKKQFKPMQLEGHVLFTQSAEAFAKMTYKGFHLDTVRAKKQYKNLTKLIKASMKDIQECPEYLEWYEWKVGEKPKLTSNKDLAEFLFKVKKYEDHSVEGDEKVDETNLLKIGTPFVKKLVQYRRLKKIRDTFLSGLIDGEHNDVVHPSYMLHTVTTYRTSSANPNFQNYPSKDKIAKDATKGCLKASPGNHLVEIDYSNWEVCTNCAYHQDPTMQEYLWSGADTHRELAAEIFMKAPEDVTEAERSLIKGLTFGVAYGSGAKSAALRLWNKMDDATKAGLVEAGIVEYQDFLDVCYKFLDTFWDVKYKGYRDWIDKLQDFYKKHGYLELATGFIAHGPWSYNNVMNTIGQGTACHILLWTIVQVMKVIEKKGMRSRIIGQIHDSLLADVPPDELEEFINIVNHYGTEAAKSKFPLLETVPVKMDAEITLADKPWSTKDKFEKFKKVTKNGEIKWVKRKKKKKEKVT